MECQRQSSTVLSSAALRASFSLREMIHLGMPTESPFLFSNSSFLSTSTMLQLFQSKFPGYVVLIVLFVYVCSEVQDSRRYGFNTGSGSLSS